MKSVASPLSTLISIEYDRLGLCTHYQPKRENRKAESGELKRSAPNRQKTRTIIEFGIELRHRLDDLSKNYYPQEVQTYLAIRGKG